IVSFYVIVDGHPCPLGPLDPLLYWYFILTSILNLNQVLLELIRQTDEQTELKFVCTYMSRVSSLRRSEDPSYIYCSSGHWWSCKSTENRHKSLLWILYLPWRLSNLGPLSPLLFYAVIA